MQVGKDQLDDLKLDESITMRIWNGISGTLPKQKDGGDGRP